MISPTIKAEAEKCRAVLEFDEDRLSLRDMEMKQAKPICVEFTKGAVAHRRRSGIGKKQLIAKAIGMNSHVVPYVLDATAGLGKDSFAMASLGCTVQMTERVPVIAALLKNGLDRALKNNETKEIAARISLFEGNAIDWLKNAAKKPDVIYIDTMFPERTKSSLVKKESRILRKLAGNDKDAPALLEAAIEFVKYRVVVKRPRKSPQIDGAEPTYVINGKTIRYDIYVIKGMHNS
ncbi:MAG: class I SAM-dependent methyltransferase [Alphaproteobacteria bacterium]|nr:class I SAM-dependent methyltransferase [Alphaproteobacteria bacterium]